MLIVPTEKRLDWQHTPLVLMSIVILNVFVFFFYQAGDEDKLIAALEGYYEHELFEKEWEIYQEWERSRTGKGDNEDLDYLKAFYEQGDYDNVAVSLLINLQFYDYLEANARTLFYDDYLSVWQEERWKIHDDIVSISTFAGGLIASKFKISALFAHQFLHGGLMHLLGNMFFLLVCGFAVEAALGHLRFLIFYLVGGFFAGFAQMAVDFSSSVPLVGASGAISGVMAMYLGIFRFKKIEFFYWFFFFVGYIRAPALFILPFYLGKELYSFYSDPDSNVAFMAHAGGFVAGTVLILGSLLVNRNVLNEEYIEADQDVDPGREKLARVYLAIEELRFESANKQLKEIIDETGLTFELALLRFNIFKLSRSKAYVKCFAALVNIRNLQSHELHKLEDLWLSHPQLAKHLDQETLVRLGMRLSSLAQPEVAIAILKQLQADQCQLPDLNLLAEKIKYASQKA